MNLRHPFEQLIADKLKKLPAPDADASWQQMKRLLDEEEDRGGGAKRPPGNKNGWWRIGIIAIVLSTSLWLYVDKTTAPNAALTKNNTTAPATASQKTAETANSSLKNTSNSNNNQTATIDNNTTLPVTNASALSKSNDKINSGVIDKSTVAGNSKNSSPVNNSVTAAAISKTNENDLFKLTHTKSVNIPGYAAIKNSTGNRRGAGNNLTTGPIASKENKRIKETAVDNNYTTGEENEEGADISSNTKASYSYGKNNGRIKSLHDKANNRLLHDGNAANSYYLPVNQPDAAEEKIWFGKINEPAIPGAIPSANTSLAVGDSIESHRNTNNLLNTETKKQVAKAQRDKEIEDLTKKDKKSFHLDLSNVFKPFSLHIDADPRWAAGIVLNSGITVNAQNRYNYNMNAKSGTLTDYIPSLYLQFHLNDYVYAQTEINFISPQYTPQLLVYQQSNDITGMTGVSQQKSIYIQKLYYFNLPVSLHYSPINNFYFSAGLQYSSFQSGLVSIQEKQYTTASGPDHATSVSNSIVKFKDDSIAQKLSPNEWRWQVGADYYWNRFSFGMRYNRSFKDLLNVNLSGTLPSTSLRNQSLIFFVRYNLFESRKKGEPSQKN